MPKIPRLLGLAIALATSVATLPTQAAPDKRPNFLVIVADDLGYSDLGAFGGEIATPNLDALALSGLRLTDWHTAPTCSPTRSMLLSGTDNHRAGLATMAELVAPNQKGKPGHEGYLSPKVASLAELLSANGYRTLQSGKWHLGLTPQQDPSARGFQHSFVMLQGAHNHFGTDLTTDPSKPGATYRENGQTLSALPADFYSSDSFTTKLIDQLRTTAIGKDGQKPFFAYLTFTAPHWPLQARQSDIARYKGRYDAGFEALRAARLKRQAELGLIDPNKPAHDPTYNTRWNQLTSAQQQVAARDMEIYAAMIDRLDQNVGRVIAELKRQGVYDNTVILFTADNGAEGMDLETTQLKGMKERLATSDNNLANRGNANSYIAYGPAWAQAATAPSWLYKAYATEGGTRAVAFIHYPRAQKQASIAPIFGSVMDVAPTFLDLAGIADPKGQFAGRTVEPIRGKSWADYLSGKADRVYAANDAVGTELFGSRAIRQGDWKITDVGDGQWHLFNLSDDPGETHDLSREQPDRLAHLIAQWDAYATDVGVILPDQRIYAP
ncbi:arylsulfatase [Sphingobium sp. D43FB]|uniref:arylsulfatase n=1 Tax=Sphingobium sp. D43FB TaxID=2017595 RepID=UPI000BB54319|nr:arylsulfatase [Sphingobium sp. D43FB]PBN41824.1 arylsulfatase [Sphingobium sp. D43FB]